MFKAMQTTEQLPVQALLVVKKILAMITRTQVPYRHHAQLVEDLFRARASEAELLISTSALVLVSKSASVLQTRSTAP